MLPLRATVAPASTKDSWSSNGNLIPILLLIVIIIIIVMLEVGKVERERERARERERVIRLDCGPAPASKH